MHLRVVFAGSVAKERAPDAVNEDSFAYCEEQQRFCISDGAGQSYAPALWSGILAGSWISHMGAIGSVDRLARAIRCFDDECDPASLGWSRSAAFNRGTFATVLGVRLHNDSLRAVAIGDSLAAIIPPDGSATTFPYTEPEEFDRAPDLLSTLPTANNVFTLRAIRNRCRAWRLRAGTRVFLMTDALGRWLLSRRASRDSCDELAAIRTADDLQAFIDVQRTCGGLKLDDVTLVHLLVEDRC